MCSSDPANHGMQCLDADQKPNFLKYEQTEKYLCVSPAAARTLLESCKLGDGPVKKKE